MKKIFGGIITLLALTLLPAATQAATVEVNQLSSDIVFFMDFDVLVLDFDLIDAENDTLNTLSVQHSGSARPGIDFTKLVLWSDDSVEGFQGWGFDKQLAVAEDVNGLWIFKNINELIDSNNKRFYVSIDTGNVIQDKNSQFILSDLDDSNTDGIWQEGESGIFLSSGGEVINNGFTASKVISFKSTKADIVPPKGYISNLAAPDIQNIFYTLAGGKITFNGVARDRGGNVVSAVVVIVNDQEIAAQSTLGQYDEWTANYTPTQDLETLAIALQITDSISQTWTSPIYQATVDTRSIDGTKTFFSRSKVIIKPDGADTSILTLTVLDSLGDFLPNREIDFVLSRQSDELNMLSATTDEAGKVALSLTSIEEGTVSIQALVDGVQIAITSVTVLAEGEADPEPSEPVVLPDGLSTGDLIKASLDAVYYLDSQGKRHVFVNDRIYGSWYGNDFSTVKTITDAVLASIPLGDPVPFRPGTLLTSPSINEVYIVDFNRTLRHLGSEAIAQELFGDSWNTIIHDLSEALLFAYNFGDIVDEASDINISELESLSVTINSELTS